MSFIFGAVGTSSNAATTGGVVASGEGTCSELIWPKPSELLRLGVNGGGLPADPDAVAVGVAGGCVPELNSAQRGHLRFVSERERGKKFGMRGKHSTIVENGIVGKRGLTYSYDPFGRSGRIVSGQVIEHVRDQRSGVRKRRKRLKRSAVRKK